MAQSGNTVALKSFQSYMVNEGLLAKTVEAIKAGEKEARSTGNVQSFEVFYKGFRQNIAIGRLYIVPPSVVDKKGQNFPTALLYGCIVRTWGGEEVGDMISHKIGDSEWDEYSQANYDSIKKELFQDESGKDGKFVSLVIYAPNWLNKREYQGFQFTSDDNKLTNLTRHVVFSSYFDPRLSSAFDALMTDVETSKFDVTDITPKMNWPALAENPLKEFPLLTKEGSAKKPRFALTFKTAEEVKKEVLEPQEMDVFDSLDQALRNSLLPTSDGAGQAGEKDFTPPSSNVVPRAASVHVSAAECEKCEGEGCKFCNQTGVKKGAVAKKAVSVETYIGAAGGADVLEEIIRKLNVIHADLKKKNPRGFMDEFESRLDIYMGDIAKDMNLEYEYDPKTDTYKFYDQVGKAYKGKPSPKFEKVQASATAVHETKITNVGPGTEAHDEANQRTEGYEKEKDVPKAIINTAPIGIALDDTGVARRPEEQREKKQAKRVEGLTCMADDDRLRAQSSKVDLSASASAALESARMGDMKAVEEHTARMTEYASSMSQDNQAHHAVADHAKEIAAGKYGPTPLSISSSLHKTAYVAHVPGHRNSKGEAAPWVIKQHNTGKILESFKSEQAAKDGLKNMESHKGSEETAKNVEKTWRAKSQGADAITDHNASFDASKWGGLGKKQASSLWVGTARKVAQEFDQFTRGYIETALWSSTDNSDPSGGEPLDKNYDIRDLAPSCLQAMTEDCKGFQDENRELLDAAWNTDGQDEFRQGHDFWLTRCGHGAGYWDGDYPTTGDGLTEAAKHWGEVDIYVGDDDMIYQAGSEDLKPGWEGQRVSSKKTAATKTASSYVASLLAGGPTVESYDARSERSKTAAQKREEEMQRKYGSQRRKLGAVPQTEEDIWSETMDDIGPAPEIRLPGESEDNAQSTTGDHEINAPEADASLWSDTPEIEKGNQEEPTVEFEEAIENDVTESTEPEPSTGDGGAAADSEETSSEPKEEKSEGGSKSEWAKNRGKNKSEKKDEPKEEKEEGESKEASAKTAEEPLETSTIETVEPENWEAIQAELLDTGYAEQCPSCGAISAYSWDDANYCENCTEPMGLDLPEGDRIYHIGAASGFEWECGKCRTSWTPADSPLTAEVYTHNDPNAEFDIESSQIDAQLADKQAAPILDQAVGAPAIFYECGSCGGVHPSIETSEKLGLGWNGDCRDEHGHFEESDLPYDENTQFITLEEQMAPDFDDTILASAKTAGPNDGDDVVLSGETYCSYCGRPMTTDMDSEGVSHHMTDLGEIDYDADADHVAVAEQEDYFGTQASEKTADTADNPANEDGGDGAIEVKTDADIKNTQGDKPKFDVTGGKTAKMGKCRKCKKDRSLNDDKVCHECEQAERDAEKEASSKTADTADNPVEMKGGEGAVVDKKDSEKKDTSGPAVKNTASAKTAIFGNMGVHITKYPSGSYGFVGTVPVSFIYETEDPKIMKELAESNMPAMTQKHYGIKRRVFKSEQEAADFAASKGVEVQNKPKPAEKEKEAAGGRSKARLAELEAIIKPELISIENGAEPQYDENGKIKEDIATCGTCGLSWNDALITDRTPAPSARCPYEYVHPEIKEWRSIKNQLRQPDRVQAADVSGDMAEAKSEIVSPDTVDKDIKQPTESVEEAGKHAADVSGDIAEAKSEVGYNKGEVADEAKATDTVNPDHFAAAPAQALEGGEFPYVETLVGMGWDDTGDPGHFMKDSNRVEVLTYSDGYEVYVDGELFESGDNVDELHNTLEIVDELGIDALNAHQAADDKTACAGYGDEEDEERPIDLGIGDLADLVVEDEDAN